MNTEPSYQSSNTKIEASQPIKPKEEKADSTSKNNEQDFFESLQKKEKEEGLSTRGKGHGWTTFAEILMQDW